MVERLKYDNAISPALKLLKSNINAIQEFSITNLFSNTSDIEKETGKLDISKASRILDIPTKI